MNRPKNSENQDLKNVAQPETAKWLVRHIEPLLIGEEHERDLIPRTAALEVLWRGSCIRPSTNPGHILICQVDPGTGACTKDCKEFPDPGGAMLAHALSIGINEVRRVASLDENETA